jgi:lysophospholipase L1-like esterase
LTGVSSTLRWALLAVGFGPAVAMAVVLIATRPSAEPAPGAYVALGDSYSAGIGAERYDDAAGACLRSPQSYVQQLGRSVSSFRACGGATTGDVLRRQLAPFPHDTELVTITIGGNDAGFADVLRTCLRGSPAACDRRVARAERFVRDDLPGRLRRVYSAIRERAPQATVVVAGYPRLFAARPWCSAVGRIDEREQRRLNAGSDLLARTIATEVRRRRGFRFADVRAAFDGHGICSGAPHIRGVSRPAIFSFHPNVRGYGTYATVVERSVEGG